MARQRFIWPDLWTDPTVGVLDPLERLLFIALFSLADDEGRIDASPAYLKAAVFPYDPFSIEQVERLRDSLVASHENVILYRAGSDQVIWLARWSDHQKPKYARPSKFPPPPKSACKQAHRHPGSGSVPGRFPEDSRNASGAFPPKRVEGRGSGPRSTPDHKALGDQTDSSTSAPAALSPDKPATTVVEIYEHWKAARGKPRAGLTDQRRRKIQARLKRFTPDELRTAIDAVALDPWEERARFDDLALLFRSDDQVERFLELADRANGTATNGAGPEAAARERERRHLDAVAAREGRL